MFLYGVWRYVKSRSDQQNRGLDATDTVIYCQPEEFLNGDKSRLVRPCGLVAWSLFNDTFQVNPVLKFPFWLDLKWFKMITRTCVVKCDFMCQSSDFEHNLDLSSIDVCLKNQFLYWERQNSPIQNKMPSSHCRVPMDITYKIWYWKFQIEKRKSVFEQQVIVPNLAKFGFWLWLIRSIEICLIGEYFWWNQHSNSGKRDIMGQR